MHLTDFCQKEFQMDVIYVSFITMYVCYINYQYIIFTLFLVLTIEIHLDEKRLDAQKFLIHMIFSKLNYLNKSTSV